MRSYKAFLFLILVASISLGSCSGLPQGNSGGGGTGTANVSLVLVSDTPPSTLGLVSFKVVPTAITLTPTTGTPTTFNINSGNGFSYDLVRLQSDSGFLGTVPGSRDRRLTILVSISFLSATLAFFNGTGFTLTNRASPASQNAVCIASFAGPFTSTATTAQTVSSNTGIRHQHQSGQVPYSQRLDSDPEPLEFWHTPCSQHFRSSPHELKPRLRPA